TRHMIDRHLRNAAFSREFGRQMRFIAGPRQSGKTTLARHKLKEEACGRCYFNWDLRSVRSSYAQNPSFFMENCAASKRGKHWVCFDEIHKMPKWKNILKGAFDEYEKEIQLIVTGSARLDWFRRSGDSLAGRYFLFRLLPVTLRELACKKLTGKPSVNALDFIDSRIGSNKETPDAMKSLLEFSGFPEPLTRQSKAFHKRWHDAYIDQLIKDDLRDLTHIRELENIATLIDILPSHIGNPLSVNALTQNLQTSYNAAKNYLKALDLAYVIFQITPYNKKIARSVKKEKKIYFYDWTRVPNPSFRFENFVAAELHALITLFNDSGFGPFDLNYIRTKDGRESDFLIVNQGKPWLIIEAKLAQTSIDSHHYKHARELGEIPIVQLIAQSNAAKRVSKNSYIISAARFL
ncbi:ATP-binding protein, partial [Elusimicrobiota bacterium]